MEEEKELPSVLAADRDVDQLEEVLDIVAEMTLEEGAFDALDWDPNSFLTEYSTVPLPKTLAKNLATDKDVNIAKVFFNLRFIICMSDALAA